MALAPPKSLKPSPKAVGTPLGCLDAAFLSSQLSFPLQLLCYLLSLVFRPLLELLSSTFSLADELDLSYLMPMLLESKYFT